ncbi:MAG: flagellar hook-basal body complex protein FliE [Actinomycetota bacterium]
MTSPVPPIGVSGVKIAGLAPAQETSSTSPRPDGEGGGGGFTDAVFDALTNVGRLDAAATRAAEAAAVGDLNSVTDYMIAASEAQLTTEITVAVRDRAISAFNDIMRMQV